MSEQQDPVEGTSEEPVVSFRKPTRRGVLRRKKVEEEEVEKEDGSEDDEDTIDRKLRDIREVQQLRKRRNGMTALECALGKRIASEFDEHEDDPFKSSKTGGMMTLPEEKRKKLTAEDITSGMKDQFHKEELLFDEDEEMKKYIEANLYKNKKSDTREEKPIRTQSAEDEILLRVAEKVRAYTSKKDDELLSNQMLAGIPEVDLGIEARMKNVLETERLKGDMVANGGKPPPSEQNPKKYKRFRIE